MTDDLDRDAYTRAVDTFLLEPEALSREQLGLLTQADAALGTRAQAKRAAALTTAAQVRHARAMGQPAPKTTTGPDVEAIADVVADLMLIAAAPLKRHLSASELKIRALEEQIAIARQVLEQLHARVQDLEQLHASGPLELERHALPTVQ